MKRPPTVINSSARLFKSRVLTLAVLVSLFSLSTGVSPALPAPSFHVVQRVIDGDTFKLKTGERVRLIGVDTPESHMNNKLLGDARRAKSSVEAVLKMGKDAAAFTRKLIVKKKVRLEFDVERRDKFGRLLAYVYLEDGTFVNAEILKQGYGQVMTHPPNLRYEQLFLKLQQEARQAGRGLWNPSTAGS